MNNDFREQLIAEQLTARNLSGLFKPLLSLKDYSLNQRYTLRWLFAVGGQSVLYQAEDEKRQRFIVKMALLPYHRSAYISTQDIQQARKRLEREAHLLQNLQRAILPSFYELIYAPNPLHPKARGEDIIHNEPYLVMELIEGNTLFEITRAAHRFQNPRYDIIETLSWYVASTAVDFSIDIAKQENSYLYSDFTPHNIVLTKEPNNPLRILDAGSIVPTQIDKTLSLPFTPSYVPREYYEAYEKGSLPWPDKMYVMYTLGKLLWEVLTNRQPYVAEDPDLTEPKLKKYSQAIQIFISDLVKGQYDSFEQTKFVVDSHLAIDPKMKSELIESCIKTYATLPEDTLLEEKNAISYNIQQVKNVQLTKIRSLKNFESIRKLRYSSDDQNIAIVYRQRIEFMNSYTYEIKKEIDIPYINSINGIDFNRTGEYLALGTSEGKIYLWHTKFKKIVWQSQEKNLNGLVALNADGDLFAAATNWCAITFRPHISGGQKKYFEGLVDKGITVALAKDYPLLAVGGLWGIRLWNTETHKELGKNKFNVGKSKFVIQVGFGNKDQVLAALCIDIHKRLCYSLIQWDLSTYNLLGQIDLPAQGITDFRLASNSRLSFISSREGYIWISDGERLINQLQDCGQVVSLDYNARRQTLITASSDGEISVYTLTYDGDI